MARYEEKQSPEFFNTVRQLLGHSSVDTTFSSYGHLSSYEQTKRFTEGKFQF